MTFWARTLCARFTLFAFLVFMREAFWAQKTFLLDIKKDRL